MFWGNILADWEMAAWTSWAAASILRSRVNCKEICVAPCTLVEDIDSMPAMVENCFSSGVATALAMVSGLAPGRAAETMIMGKSTLGRSLTGSFRKAMAPKTSSASISSVVITGRRMDNSEIFISQLHFPSPPERNRCRLDRWAPRPPGRRQRRAEQTAAPAGWWAPGRIL